MAESVARICAAKPERDWEPGERAGYHPTSGMAILGAIVEIVDGRSYDRYVREAIFEPLGMDDCWVGHAARALRRVRRPHRRHAQDTKSRRRRSR